jgi:hypothetical protein
VPTRQTVSGSFLCLSRISQVIMAKTPTRPSDIQALLTAAEKKVLDGTLGESLAAATRPQLAAMRKQARALRDKWQDLFKRQSIATKRKPAPADQANARSQEKSALFGDAVKRVEARLSEIAASVTKAVGGGKKAGRSGAARAAKKPARQAGHRAERATIREELSEAMAAINQAARKLVGKATAKKSSTDKPAGASAKKAAAATAATPTAPAPVRAKRVVQKPVTSKKARQAGTRKALAVTGTGQAIAFDVKKQRKAKARATVARLKIDGEATRRKGFVVSNTKRKQAKRDSR